MVYVVYNGSVWNWNDLSTGLVMYDSILWYDLLLWNYGPSLQVFLFRKKKKKNNHNKQTNKKSISRQGRWLKFYIADFTSIPSFRSK